MVYQRLKNIPWWFFPPLCLLCGQPGIKGRDLCQSCQAILPLPHSPCRRCGTTVVAATTTVCGACLSEPPPYHWLHSAYQYAAPLDYLIRELKFRHRLPFARLLGDLLADSLATAALPDVIVPVPLHRQRLQQRGFNQSLEIARQVGYRLNIPIARSAVVRQRYTPPQSQLSWQERRRNLRQAFLATTTLPGQHIAIIDDVVTSGSTVAELSRCLNAAGAIQVQVWTVARTQPNARSAGGPTHLPTSEQM